MLFKKYSYFYLLYLIAAGLRLWYFPYLSDGLDGLMYLSIAQKYHDGYFYEAINGLRGPLISWLLALLLFIKANPLLLFGLLNVIIGLFAFHTCMQWLERFVLGRMLHAIFAVSFIAVINYFTLEQTPDLLYLTILLQLLFAMTHPAGSTYWGVISGCWGGLLYLCKGFGFPFFLSFFFLANLFYWIYADNRGVVVKRSISGIAVFLLIAGCWVGVLSYKYGALTISSVQDYNFSVLGPQQTKDSDLEIHVKDFLVYYNGLNAPPSEHCITAWEEPTLIQNKPAEWGRFESVQSITHYLLLIIRNLLAVFYEDLTRNVMAFCFVLLTFCFFSGKTIPVQEKKYLIIFFLAGLVHLGGYVLIWMETRYLWVIIILSGFGSVIGLKYAHTIFNKKIIMVVALAWGGYLIGKSLAEIKTYIPANRLSHSIYTLSDSMKIKSLGNVASVASEKTNEKYRSSVLLCLYLQGKYFGNIQATTPRDEITSQLRQHAIDYLIVWENGFSMEGYPLVFENKASSIKIYKCR